MQHTAPLFTTTACILLVLCAAHCGAVERMPLRGLLHKWPTAPGTAASAAPQLGAAEARTVNVIDYGADPSGKNDSSAGEREGRGRKREKKEKKRAESDSSGQPAHTHKHTHTHNTRVHTNAHTRTHAQTYIFTLRRSIHTICKDSHREECPNT